MSRNEKESRGSVDVHYRSMREGDCIASGAHGERLGSVLWSTFSSAGTGLASHFCYTTSSGSFGPTPRGPLQVRVKTGRENSETAGESQFS